MPKKTLIFIIVFFFIPTLSYAKEKKQKTRHTGFLFGIGFSVSSEIYKGVNTQFLPIPVIGYKGEKVNIFGPFISYNAFSISDIKLFLKAGPRFDNFDESDSYIFEGMSERKMSAEVGLGVTYEKNDWIAEIAGMHDILDRSNGFEITSKFGKTLRNGPFFFKPFIGISFLDSRHVNYYYGVGRNETNEDRTYFKSKESFNPSAGISFATPILLGGFTRFVYTHKWYDTNITGSPLTDKASSSEVLCTYSRFF